MRCHNRQIHKAKILKGGIKKRNQAEHEVKGFRLFDKVICNSTECFIFGRRSTGYMDVRTLDGTKINTGISYKKRVFKKIGGNLNSFNYFKHSRDCKKIGGCRSISRDKGIETSAFAKSGHHLFSYRKWMMPTTFFLTETT